MAMMTTVEKILAKAQQLEAKAAALRLAAEMLNEDAHASKRETVSQTLAQAIGIRHAQRNGHSRPAAAAPPRRGSAAHLARRAEKRAQVVALVKAYGKPMPIKALAAAAREVGISGLTGIRGYVDAGLLTQKGKRGKTTYSIPA